MRGESVNRLKGKCALIPGGTSATGLATACREKFGECTYFADGEAPTCNGEGWSSSITA